MNSVAQVEECHIIERAVSENIDDDDEEAARCFSRRTQVSNHQGQDECALSCQLDSTVLAAWKVK